MNSDNDTSKYLESSEGSISATPSLDLLNRRLGTSPAPRMLNKYEQQLLRQSKREVMQVAGEVFAKKKLNSQK